MSLDASIAEVIAGTRQWTVVTGDCLDVLKTLPDGCVDAVVTDPPYGIGFDSKGMGGARFAGVKIFGDDTPFDPTPWLHFPLSIMFGANNYAERLPPGGWLCWDKRCNERADRIYGSPFELAWCSDRSKFKMIRIQHAAAVSADGDPKRVHPTQKPVELMRRSMNVCGVPDDAIVLDPFCGSGTTGVACIQTGRRFIGIEIDEKYAAIARRRIADAAPLFVPVPEQKQMEFSP